MKKNIKIAPSILSADFANLEKEISILNNSEADYIHVDVMDGHFVKNLTFGPPVIEKIRKFSTKPFDVHLMIESVDQYLESYSKAGADIITIHPETTKNLDNAISKIKSLGKKAGVSLNPDVSLDKVLPIIKKIDLVLIMSVYPGFAGQKFIPDVLEKVKILREKVNKENLEVEVEIDGGINIDTAKLAKKAGANVLVAGTAVYSENKVLENIKLLKNC
ncbi:MAG: ribulose-phosphate 3-epimerase [Candidatus Pelagibacter sp.]|mgnify:CR=1 FL=1|nr:ribulose-phosphate 3-epimerase [Rickettsiales bacterium]MAJ57322.1 ribulose-phosphate 3-epimerase [Candidatus Pelagibacter sp.]|tara:strand:- start:51193 stop:51849 length:657 start_codon:yes stop_codon:yes gene_type:complete